MSFNENSNGSDWNTKPLLKKEDNTDGEKKKSLTKGKECRNFCEKWLSIFSPWLSRCEDDPKRPFCRACQQQLDNNRFRLQRHERTAKHGRNQAILLNEGEEAVRLILSNKKRYKKQFKDSKICPIDIGLTKLESEIPIKTQMIQKGYRMPIERNDSNSPYVCAKREFHDMSDYYYSPLHSHTVQPKKDSFDMFFEAISATVKSLPPKLAAEVKSRISQVIAEFELRAICEKEAQEKAQQSIVVGVPNQVSNIVTIDPIITTPSKETVGNQQSVEGPTVTQYVYSYQQKKEMN